MTAYNESLDFALNWTIEPFQRLHLGSTSYTQGTNGIAAAIPIIPTILPFLITLALVRPYNPAKAGLMGLPIYLTMLFLGINTTNPVMDYSIGIIYGIWMIYGVFSIDSVQTIWNNRESLQIKREQKAQKARLIAEGRNLPISIGLEEAKEIESRPLQILKEETKKQIEELNTGIKKGMRIKELGGAYTANGIKHEGGYISLEDMSKKITKGIIKNEKGRLPIDIIKRTEAQRKRVAEEIRRATTIKNNILQGGYLNLQEAGTKMTKGIIKDEKGELPLATTIIKPFKGKEPRYRLKIDWEKMRNKVENYGKRKKKKE